MFEHIIVDGKFYFTISHQRNVYENSEVCMAPGNMVWNAFQLHYLRPAP